MKSRQMAFLLNLSLALVILLVLFNRSGIALSIEVPSATMFHVAPSGNDSDSCGATTMPCRTIQQAVDLANDDDTILVAAGTYTDSNECFPSAETAVVCIWNYRKAFHR